jgi:type II secretory pathway component PulM
VLDLVEERLQQHAQQLTAAELEAMWQQAGERNDEAKLRLQRLHGSLALCHQLMDDLRALRQQADTIQGVRFALVDGDPDGI